MKPLMLMEAMMTNRQFNQLKQQAKVKQYKSYAWTALFLLAGTLILSNAFIGALDKSAANQHRMLCESAAISGNDYINNCK